MNKNNIDTYALKTDAIILQGDYLLESHLDDLNIFSPNNPENIYTYNIFHTSIVLKQSYYILKNIFDIKKNVSESLQVLLKTEGDITNKFDEICTIRSLERSLYEMESKIFTYPLSRFVEMVQQEGTILDIVGAIEKLRYDKIHNDMLTNVLCNDIDRTIIELLPEKIDRAIDDLVSTFEEQYSHDAYIKIQQFREKFLIMKIYPTPVEGYEQNFDILINTDDIIPGDLYEDFIISLKNALAHDLFPNSGECIPKK